MSKDIWHSALEIPVFDDTVVFIDDLNNWHTGYTQRDNDGITDHDSGEIYTEENVLKWAYIKDLLALEQELIHTKELLEIESSEHELCHDAMVKRTEEVNRIRKTLETGNKDLSDKIGKLETELELTRKMLKIAVGAIETIKYSKKSDAINLRHKANKALIEIWKIKDQTALEQKDVK